MRCLYVGGMSCKRGVPIGAIVESEVWFELVMAGNMIQGAGWLCCKHGLLIEVGWVHRSGSSWF
jgi:hypothetical protein